MTSATAGWLLLLLLMRLLRSVTKPPFQKSFSPAAAGEDDRQGISGEKMGKIVGASYKSQTALIHKAASKTATAAPIFPFTTTPKDDSRSSRDTPQHPPIFATTTTKRKPRRMCHGALVVSSPGFDVQTPALANLCRGWLNSEVWRGFADFTSIATEYFAQLDKSIIYYGN